MALKFSNFQGSYQPSGEWQSGAETEAYVRSEMSRPYSGVWGGGAETSPGTFTFPGSPAPSVEAPYEYATPRGTVPTSPVYSGLPTITPRQQIQTPQQYRAPGTTRTYGRASSGPTTSTTTWTPSGEMPTYEAGTFVAPEYDEKAILAGQQKFAAPGIRRLREQVQVAQAQTYENPNVKAMTVREALQGYGSGLETTMAGAYSRATADYDRRFKLQWEEGMANFRAREEAKSRSFQAALTAWGKTGTTTTTTGGGAGGPAAPATTTGARTPYTTTRVPGTPSRGY